MVFLLISGVYSYIKIPKELFPDIALDKIMVTGSYAGSSANALDKMAVRDIEDGITSVTGISKIETIITPGTFVITLTLDENYDARNILDNVKDTIAANSMNLPSDMNLPIAKSLVHSRDLIRMSLASDKLSFDELNVKAKKIRSELLKVQHISEIAIYGDSDKKIEMLINEHAIKAYDLNPSDVVAALQNLSYIYPIGDIDDKDGFIFVSTVNGKNSVESWLNTQLHVDGKYFYLSDVAEVKIYHPQDKTKGSFNAVPSLTFSISKDNQGNSIELSKQLHKRVEALNKENSDISLELFHDSSKPIKNRLNVIISNLSLGLVLIFFSMYLLINRNTAIVVTLGVPFSFIIGLIFIYVMGYSLNVVSLIGALLVVGIAVDDAVVVSENIQRHIDEGEEPHDAAMIGIKEMMLPITLATMTTVVAFLPLFMMNGEMGLFIKLIPVVVIMVLIGSLLESFLFLPLHAKTLLNKGSKSLSWKPVSDRYEKLLHVLLSYKKTTLMFFFILVPLLSVVTLKSLSFQFFPSFDSDKYYVTAKLDNNRALDDTFDIATEIEKELLSHKEELYIKSISQISGYRRNMAMLSERGSNHFYLTIELYEKRETNFVNKYINPILDMSFDFNPEDKIRELYVKEIIKRTREYLAPIEKKYPFEEFGVIASKVGLVKTDLEINLVSNDDKAIQKAIATIREKMQSIDGVESIVDNIRYGKKEYKIKVNEYGESLGLSEAYVAKTLSNYFLGNRKALSFDNDGVLEITTEYANKDSIDKLIDFEIPLSDGRKIELQEVADFVIVQDYAYIEKENGDIVKTISANVDKSKTTAISALEELKETLNAIEKEGIRVDILGEQEKNNQLKEDMIKSSVIAMFLMLILLLLIFPKIKYALMVLSVIPFSFFGAFVGHLIVGMPMTMPSVIGLLGLAGVVINDGIIMLEFLHGTHETKEFYYKAKLRLRPIVITSLTTFLGLSTLIFFATGQAKIMQPLAISLGFGLIWGTVMNLLYLPTLYALVNKIKPNEKLI